MFSVILLTIVAFSVVGGASESLDSSDVRRASRNGIDGGLSVSNDASQLVQSGNNNVAGPSMADFLSLQSVLAQLQAEMEAKDQLTLANIQQLQTEMAAKDQRIQDLEQRDYVERCESGDLGTPSHAFTSGNGDRHVDLTATFSRAFRTTPVVTVGLRHVDHFATEIRVSATVQSVSTTSLTVRIGTWVDSRLYAANVYWMACA
ncbi:uncharacterized protein LOC118412649 [Branchiostoma floridae]|uniref:Uncharacterized protein LOC118412649 n=1 Tax=Branchiostoma floridae TaxID=7739 RepID=A0A9J7MLL1_BRAFL|nr:uncharacterized protein LOC118412649 [Branchiostoma floridae]